MTETATDRPEVAPDILLGELPSFIDERVLASAQSTYGERTPASADLLGEYEATGPTKTMGGYYFECAYSPATEGKRGYRSIVVKGREDSRSDHVKVELRLFEDQTFSCTYEQKSRYPTDKGLEAGAEPYEPQLYKGSLDAMPQDQEVIEVFDLVARTMDAREQPTPYEEKPDLKSAVFIPEQTRPPKFEAGYAIQQLPEKGEGNGDDAIALDPENGIFVVCDGVSQEPQSQVAARDGASYLVNNIRGNMPVEPIADISAAMEFETDVLTGAAEEAHDRIVDWEDRTDQSGTTVIAFGVLMQAEKRTEDEPDRYYFAYKWFGDARAYVLLPTGQLHQLTQDQGNEQGAIYNHLGSSRRGGPPPRPSDNIIYSNGKTTYNFNQGSALELPEGSRLILLTDGLTGHGPYAGLSNSQEMALREEEDPKAAAQKALDLSEGVPDDKAIIVVNCGKFKKVGLPEDLRATVPPGAIAA